jgi:hypothetical protein
MPSSPRHRSISDFAESPSPISHAESSPLATTDMRLNDCNTDSGYCSMGNNPQAQGQWSFGPPQGRMLCDVPRVSGPQSDLVVPLPSPPWATNFDFSPLNYFGEWGLWWMRFMVNEVYGEWGLWWMRFMVNEVYGACFILIGWRYVLRTPECSWRLFLLAHLKHPYMKMQIMGKVCVMSHCSSTWPPTRRTSMTWSCRRRAFHGTRVFW